MESLAIFGGAPVRTTPLSPWPQFTSSEIEVASNVLRSGKVNYWTGEHGRSFEREFSTYHSVDHGVALANGTLALELALRVLGIKRGDEVIVTPRSYFASASCIALCGAIPVFADICRNSQNITAASVEAVITKKTRAIIAVHLAGWPCEMNEIVALARDHNLSIIEDCAQAHGARLNSRLVGSFGDCAAFSFCQDKIMTTAGEGGMLILHDKHLWRRAWAFKDHGKDFEKMNSNDHPPGFRWLHESIGTNWRLTELQAAIGRIQLENLEDSLSIRRRNSRILHDGLSNIEALRLPSPPAHVVHANYKFYAFIRPKLLRHEWSRDRVLEALQAEGVPGLSGSCPEIYREKAFSASQTVRLPVAKELGETSIMFPVHPTLLESELHDIVTAVSKVMAVATKR